jgi:hypothetical protein
MFDAREENRSLVLALFPTEFLKIRSSTQCTCGGRCVTVISSSPTLSWLNTAGFGPYEARGRKIKICEVVSFEVRDLPASG